MENNVMKGDFFTELDLAEQVERMLVKHGFDDETQARLIEIADLYRELKVEFWDILRQAFDME